jgi:hypothetical protein
MRTMAVTRLIALDDAETFARLLTALNSIIRG